MAGGREGGERKGVEGERKREGGREKEKQRYTCVYGG